MGDWAFERRIDNGVCVEGIVRFTPAGNGRLHYRETGRMRLPGGAELDAYAGYLFEQANGRLTMLFCEQPRRLFQSFKLLPSDGALSGESVHACPPDVYESRIVLAQDGCWTLTHAVSGPRKAYVSITAYRRG